MKHKEKSYTLIGVVLLIIVAILAYGMYKTMETVVVPAANKEIQEEAQTE